MDANGAAGPITRLARAIKRAVATATLDGVPAAVIRASLLAMADRIEHEDDEDDD